MRFYVAGKVLGTSPQSIDNAEDRHKFSTLLDELGIDQPEWRDLVSVQEARAFAERVNYPVLVRPSYVLNGAAMGVAPNEAELTKFLERAAEISRKHLV